MEYISVKEVAIKWGISERSVRNYCANGRVSGAKLVGKTWTIPSNAEKPNRENPTLKTNELLYLLKEEKENKLSGGIYHKTQIELTYNSNHIEGSTLTHDETRYIFETNTIGLENKTANVDDIVETANHFSCINYIIENAKKSISESMIKHLHYMLKNGTNDSRKSWFNIGDYKKLPNEVGGEETCSPDRVSNEMNKLITEYNNKKEITIEDIIKFHKEFESIHPFQDGNGRVGRLIMFKECLKNDIVPFIIDEEHKLYYYRGLKEWNNDKAFLVDTCLSCQDKYKLWLDYFKIKY